MGAHPLYLIPYLLYVSFWSNTMSNQLMTFSKIDYKVAMFMIGNEQWVQLKTVVESLGLSVSNVAHVAERLPEDYKKLVDMQIFDSAQNDESEAYKGTNNLRKKQWFINKAGAYRIILTSNSPKAEPFLRWLETEVIPSIESKGYYINKAAVAQSPEKVEALYDEVTALRVEEKAFFAKVKQYFAMATDYDPNNKEMQAFFAKLQNMFLYAITQHTAAEIVIDKIDHDKERCGMVQDVPVTKANLAVSKNYLEAVELYQLRNLSNLYLNCLESFKVRDHRVTTQYLMTFFDQLLRDLKYGVLSGQNHPSCKQRDRTVQREYNLYKQLQIA